jgi:hypothetical protein
MMGYFLQNTIVANTQNTETSNLFFNNKNIINMSKTIEVKISIRGVENWGDFHDSKPVKEWELELRKFEKEIRDKIHNLTGGSISDIDVLCNLIF